MVKIKYGKMKYGIFGIMTLGMIFLYGCNKLFPDEKLTIQRVDYTGNELRTDGYYYYQDANYTVVEFLYRNSIILSARAYSFHDLNIVEKKMLERYNEIRADKIGWGVFRISGKTIEYEMWDTSVGGGLPILKCIGIIDNDTTFRIIQCIELGKKFEKNEVYHFRQFSPKPDSTNKWIK
jgi:hypothetical protein